MPDQKPQATKVATKLKQKRSPGYPAISLGVALEKLALIYGSIKTSEAPEEAVFSAMEYKGASGASLPVMAALKAFGLLESAYGSATAKVSQLGLRILVDQRPDESEKLASIRQAALNPPMHAHMWEKYGKELPDDTTLKYHLTIQKEFTEAGALTFIKEYRDTFAFAKLAGAVKLPPESKDETKKGPQKGLQDDGLFRGFFGPFPKADAPVSSAPTARPGMKQANFPLDEGEGEVILQWPAKMSAASYEDMKAWLPTILRRVAKAVEYVPAGPSNAVEDDRTFDLSDDDLKNV